MSDPGNGSVLDRRGAWVLLLVASIVWVALAAWLVPWQWSPGRLDPVPASDYFTDAEIARAESFADFVRPRADAGLAVGIAAALLLGWTAWGRRVASSMVRRLPWWIGVPILVLAFELVVRAVRLPLAWQIRSRRLQEGLTEQDAVGWWTDQSLSLLVSWVVASIGLLLLVACVRRWPRRWYLPVGVGALVATYALSMAYPLLVEPLFNRFTPLPKGQLRSELVSMADRQEVDVGEVLVADASRRTTTLNAYVSGLGETKRLVLYDTLVADAPPGEVVAVAAHEVAHAARRDVLVGTTLGAVGAVVGVAALSLLLGRRGRRRPELARPQAAWPVLAAVMVATVAVSPVQNTISRAIETRADVDALRTTSDAGAFRDLHTRLARRSLADPTPPTWRQLTWGSHPTVLERLGLLREHPGDGVPLTD